MADVGGLHSPGQPFPLLRFLARSRARHLKLPKSGGRNLKDGDRVLGCGGNRSERPPAFGPVGFPSAPAYLESFRLLTVVAVCLLTQGGGAAATRGRVAPAAVTKSNVVRRKSIRGLGGWRSCQDGRQVERTIWASGISSAFALYMPLDLQSLEKDGELDPPSLFPVEVVLNFATAFGIRIPVGRPRCLLIGRLVFDMVVKQIAALVQGVTPSLSGSGFSHSSSVERHLIL